MKGNEAATKQCWLNPIDATYNTAAISWHVPENLISTGNPVVIAITDCNNQVKFSWRITTHTEYNLFAHEVNSIINAINRLICEINEQWSIAEPILREVISACKKVYNAQKEQDAAHKLVGLKSKPSRFNLKKTLPGLPALYKNPLYIERAFINHSGNDGGVSHLFAILQSEATVGEGEYSLSFTDGKGSIRLHGHIMDSNTLDYLEGPGEKEPKFNKASSAILKLSALMIELMTLDCNVYAIHTQDLIKTYP